MSYRVMKISQLEKSICYNSILHHDNIIHFGKIIDHAMTTSYFKEIDFVRWCHEIMITLFFKKSILQDNWSHYDNIIL